jgi:hypothetical protein
VAQGKCGAWSAERRVGPEPIGPQLRNPNSALRICETKKALECRFGLRSRALEDLRRIATDGVAGRLAESGVLLHVPLATQAIPEKLVPQSELICRRLFQVFRFHGCCECSSRPVLHGRVAPLIIGNSSIPVHRNRAVGVRKSASSSECHSGKCSHKCSGHRCRVKGYAPRDVGVWLSQGLYYANGPGVASIAKYLPAYADL